MVSILIFTVAYCAMTFILQVDGMEDIKLEGITEFKNKQQKTNNMKPKIAVLENGKFAIQMSRFPKSFLDLQSAKHTWSPGDTYFKDCIGDLETCREKLKAISIKVVGYIE